MATEISKEDIIDFNEKEVAAAQKQIWKYILGFTPLAVVKCAIELGIPDILEERKSPVSLDDLASVIGCSQSSLHRVMKFLVHHKVFEEKPLFEYEATCVGYTQTALSRLLTRGGKDSMADVVLLMNSKTMVDPWHKLSGWVLGNKELPFDATYGTDMWGYCAKNPHHTKLFNDGMASVARASVAAVLEDCPELFKGVTRVVDVGGGDGTALRLIVEACPWIKGINFDLPHMIASVPPIKGVEHVGGDMFDHIPKADAVYLMKVLHNWADKQCIDILKKCREAIPKDTGKVIIVNIIVGRDDDDELEGVGLMMDMAMMTLTSHGKERTVKEWSSLFDQAGFSRYTVKHLRTPHCVIEVYP